ncbi:alpha/beta-like subunit of transcription factor IIA [Hamiltosporidium tvaerminnensis]|uniref:Alpha/beta-like subunit of transcription factor IIA n=2 Tax=Hamiltosporidium TaxID=1176354 RepID=A0A4V2JU96_9MICR|nr:transcription factor IIA subunit alpha [Hamiltosporidium tvaerminnensis]TBT99191.1 alpha/beta-like subunit of transcription factor IIA [Hamiltosporidium magnivora]TBU01493.1 alpha/beta-like subunit of transcription factor IIA [Hamiltosporidium tvaerminnensis]TBU04748.1 alpha/beta-like subunit of transcription factor IIA [Hamiltosporidium magnivora]TBU20770.1 alpha/beta-like subunit of transcription factor IIA [Hamiltosporidium tvaerminnensis]
MNYEMTSLYRNIIEEVSKSLELDKDETFIDINIIQDIKMAWTKKLKEYTSPPDRDSLYYSNVSSSYNPSEFKSMKRLMAEEVERGREVEARSTVSDDLSLTESDEIKEEHTNNYMMCLYEKVTKSKNKWRCAFKQGFINIGNTDFAFSTANGDLEW